MKVSKWNILFFFLQFRWSRHFRSNRISRGMKIRWKRNLEKSPFYANILKSGQGFPIMNKSKFMANFDRINTVGVYKKDALAVALKSEETRDFSPMIGEISVGLSSGTSGNKGIFLTSKREKEIWVGAVLDRVIGLTLRKRKVAFFLRANNNLYESVKSGRLAFHFFDTKIPVVDQMDQLLALEADILVGQPSILLEIAKGIDNQSIKPSFTKVISVAEVLELDQKKYFEQVFGCRIDQIYQCTEGFLGYTCAKGNLHFNEDWLKIEKKYLDESQTRFHPVITDYLRSSQPVVRYELNDIIHEGAPCSCGSKSTVIEKIEGRSDDVFRFAIAGKEIIIYPDFIRRAILNSSDLVTNYMVTRKTKNQLELYLEVEQKSDFDKTFNDVKNSLQSLLLEFGVDGIDVVSVDYERNPISKFRRIKNEYRASI